MGNMIIMVRVKFCSKAMNDDDTDVKQLKKQNIDIFSLVVSTVSARIRISNH
jgi:hypothetical protein